MATAAKSTWNDCGRHARKSTHSKVMDPGPRERGTDQAYADAQRKSHQTDSVPLWVYELLTMLHNLG